MKTIFIVDDSDTNLATAELTLEDYYNVITMPSAVKMFFLLELITPDLILLDIEMPDMNGFDALIRLKNNKWADIPVIFLTANTDPETEVKGFKIGAVDFVKKPFSPPVLLNRIKTHLDIDTIIRERMMQLMNLQNSMISVLADFVEKRDKETGGHIERTSTYIEILINEMKSNGVYLNEINDWDIDKIILSAKMHDLGKISITDDIINKPGKLTDEEFNIMKTHTLYGEEIINDIIRRTGEGEFLNYAKLFAGCHHERWDGNGYPRGLKGMDIPLQGRIMAIADVYDALVSARPYKKPFTHEDAVQIIMENADKQYDPNICEIFFKVNNQFKQVSAS